MSKLKSKQSRKPTSSAMQTEVDSKEYRSRSIDGGLQRRRLFVMRHGERVDFTFGRGWIAESFDLKGNYIRLDLNMPSKMVRRDNYKDFVRDSPLTEMGRFMATVTGEAFKSAGVDIQNVYASPSLRCVQTAQGVIDGMGNQAVINIEPSAFEWMGWYLDALPIHLSPQQFVDNGFNVNVNHRPLVNLKDMNVHETVEEYYIRCQFLAEHLLQRHAGGDILVVAHAGSLDTFTRGLQKKGPRNTQDMHSILSSFTYCCMCCLGENTSPDQWSLEQPPIPPLLGFDWRVLS